MTAPVAPHVRTKDLPTRAVLEAAEASWKSYHLLGPEMTPTHALLMSRFGCSIKVAYAAMSREVDRGLLEPGVSLWSSYVSEDGKKYLKRARKADKATGGPSK